MARVTEPPLINPEAEIAVIGALLMDPSAIPLVRSTLDVSDFAGETRRLVYDAICSLADRGMSVDVLTVGDALKERGVALMPELVDAINRVPSAVHVESYARIVRELAQRRRLLEAAARLSAAACDEERDFAAVVAEACQRLRDLSDGHEGRVQTSSQAAHEFADLVERWTGEQRDVWGLPTGLSDLDALTGGLETGELTVLAGLPGHGKSALALQIALHVAQRGRGVMYFSLEMPIPTLIMREVCAMAEVNSMDLRKGRISDEERVRLLAALSTLHDLPLYWCYMPRPTLVELEAELSKQMLTTSIALVVVDYMQLMAHGQERAVEMGDIANGLKALAGEYDVALLAVSSLSRGLWQRDVKLPRLSDLRWSGDLEFCADKVLIVFREEELYRERLQEPPLESQGVATLVLAKHRNGQTGHVDVVWRAAYGQFRDMARVK